MESKYWKSVDEGLMVSCLNCGPEQRKYLGDTGISPGFGVVTLRNNNYVIYQTVNASRAIIRQWKKEVHLNNQKQNFFTIDLETPMRGSRWTYDGKRHWVLTHTSMGFA